MKGSLRLYANYSLKKVASEFEADYNAVRHQLVGHEIHEATRYGSSKSK